MTAPKYGEFACNCYLAGVSIIRSIETYAKDNNEPVPTDEEIEAAMAYVRREFPYKQNLRRKK